MDWRSCTSRCGRRRAASEVEHNCSNQVTYVYGRDPFLNHWLLSTLRAKKSVRVKVRVSLDSILVTQYNPYFS